MYVLFLYVCFVFKTSQMISAYIRNLRKEQKSGLFVCCYLLPCLWPFLSQLEVFAHSWQACLRSHLAGFEAQSFLLLLLVVVVVVACWPATPF